MTSRPLTSLALPARLLGKLTAVGYTTVSELRDLDADSLANELKLPIEACSEILSACNASSSVAIIGLLPSQAASTLLASRAAFGCGVPLIDSLIHGGLKKGEVLEISGPPGSGKRQLALEFVKEAVSAGDEVLVMDCQNFARPEHIRQVVGHDARRVHRVSIPDLNSLFAFLNQLHGWINTNSSISLILINSLTFHLQSSLTSLQKQRLLALVKQTLTRVGAMHGVTCIATTQMATKMINPDGSATKFEAGGGRGVMVPALGDAWLPSSKSYRLILYRNHEGKRFARRTICPGQQKASSSEHEAPFGLDNNGRICGVE